MNEIIKQIEAEQLKSEIPQFNVGDILYMTGGSGVIYHEDLCYHFE